MTALTPIFPLRVLLEHLLAQDFEISIETMQRMALYANVRTDKGDFDWQKAKYQLGALICKSNLEQQVFYKSFDTLKNQYQAGEQKAIEAALAMSDIAITPPMEPETEEPLEHEVPEPPEEPPVLEDLKAKVKMAKPTFRPLKPLYPAAEVGGPIQWNLFFPTPVLKIWNLAALDQPVKNLREKDTANIEEWNITKSIAKTIKSAGIPYLEKYYRKRAPQYLLLIEQKSKHDHLAHFYAELAAELNRRDIAAEVFFYNKIPNRCWKNPLNSGKFTSIHALQAEYYDYKLLIVGSADGLLDLPILSPSGLTYNLLEKWQNVALLVTRPTSEWDNHEAALAHLMPVVPANPVGLGTLHQQWKDHLFYPIRHWQWSYPEIGTTSVAIWPNTKNFNGFFSKLEYHIGKKAVGIIAATALYNDIYWELTLDLMRVIGHLEDQQGNTIHATLDPDFLNWLILQRISRITWFRTAHIPPQVRKQLRKKFDRDHSPEIRLAARNKIIEILNYHDNRPPDNSYAKINHGFNVNWLQHEIQMLDERLNTVERKVIEDQFRREVLANIAWYNIEDQLGADLWQDLAQTGNQNKGKYPFWAVWFNRNPHHPEIETAIVEMKERFKMSDVRKDLFYGIVHTSKMPASRAIIVVVNELLPMSKAIIYLKSFQEAKNNVTLPVFVFILDGQPMAQRNLARLEEMPLVKGISETWDQLVEQVGRYLGIDQANTLEGSHGEIPTETPVGLDYEGTDPDAKAISPEKAKAFLMWDQLELDNQNQTPVKGVITSSKKGGFNVLLDTYNQIAFLPRSHADIGPISSEEDLIGKPFEFLINKLTPKLNNIVVSRKRYLEQQLSDERRAILETLTIGKLIKTSVKNINEELGLFLEIGAGLSGLLHLNKIFFKEPDLASHYTVGEALEVYVIQIEREPKLRIEFCLPESYAILGLEKRVERDVFLETLQTGGIFRGRVTNVVEYGIFVTLGHGTSGLLPYKNMSQDKEVQQAYAFSAGDELNVRLLDIDPEYKRMSFTLPQIFTNKWESLPSYIYSGAVLSGSVQEVRNSGLLVSLTTEITGVIDLRELSAFPDVRPIQCFKVGHILQVKILSIKEQDKSIHLSYKALALDKGFDYLAMYRNGEIYSLPVKDVVQGEIVVEPVMGAITVVYNPYLHAHAESLRSVMPGRTILAKLKHSTDPNIFLFEYIPETEILAHKHLHHLGAGSPCTVEVVGKNADLYPLLLQQVRCYSRLDMLGSVYNPIPDRARLENGINVLHVDDYNLIVGNPQMLDDPSVTYLENVKRVLAPGTYHEAVRIKPGICLLPFNVAGYNWSEIGRVQNNQKYFVKIEHLHLNPLSAKVSTVTFGYGHFKEISINMELEGELIAPNLVFFILNDLMFTAKASKKQLKKQDGTSLKVRERALFRITAINAPVEVSVSHTVTWKDKKPPTPQSDPNVFVDFFQGWEEELPDPEAPLTEQ